MPAVQSFGGRFSTNSTSLVQAHEAGLPQRTIVVEFDSYDLALPAHKSEAYQKALHALGSGAERDFRIVEGVKNPLSGAGHSPAIRKSRHLTLRQPALKYK